MTFYIFFPVVSNTSGGNLSGRMYRETNYAQGWDRCWHSGSPIPKFESVSGTGAVVLPASNVYPNGDTVGWGTAAVTHYRSHDPGNIPCETWLYQRMEIACGVEASPSWHQVQSQVLKITIGATTLTTFRGSTGQGPHNYP